METEASNTLETLSQDITQVVERTSRSVVAVNARRSLSSSGVCWRKDIIVTAAHAIRRSEDISVILPNGQTVVASLAGVDRGTDLAVLKVNDAELSEPDFGDSSQLQVGQIVLAIGRGSQRGLNATLGIVGVLSGAWRAWAGGSIEQYIGLDLVLHPAAAGGPLVDAHGRILGINTPALSRIMAVTIPVATVNHVVDQLLEKGHIGRGYLGLGMQRVPLPEDMKNALQLSVDSGLIVVTVEPEGPGGKAGVQFADVIVSLEGAAVGSIRDLQPFLEPESIGKTVVVSLIRGGKVVEVTLTIGERKRRDS